MGLPFRDAFAGCFGCDPQDFPNEALKQCLYPHARIMWPLLELAGGPPVLAAQAFMSLVSETCSKDELMDAIESYRDEVRPHSGVLARRLYLRVSVERLLAMHHFVRETEKHRMIEAATSEYHSHTSSNTYSGSTVS
jgi:hypothetical protein